jgi:hypothetical protein
MGKWETYGQMEGLGGWESKEELETAGKGSKKKWRTMEPLAPSIPVSKDLIWEQLPSFLFGIRMFRGGS